MERRWTVWYFAPEADHPKCHTADSEGEAAEWKRRLLRSGVECVVTVNPRNEVTDCERAAEGASLDEVLRRGRHVGRRSGLNCLRPDGTYGPIGGGPGGGGDGPTAA